MNLFILARFRLLKENCHTIVIIEHDPLLHEDAQQKIEYVSQAMREASEEVAVLLYEPGADPYFEELVNNADRLFYFDGRSRAEARAAGKDSSQNSEELDCAGEILVILCQLQ